MKKYIVIALSVAGKGKKIFHSGNEVTEFDFPEGEAEKRVKDGFLKPKAETSTGKTAEELAAEEEADKKLKAQKLLDDEAATQALKDRALALDLDENSTLEEIEAEEDRLNKHKAGSKNKK